jgi:hypothetical protein
MIQIKAVNKVPDGFDLHLDAQSKSMWDKVGVEQRDRLCARSKRIWLVYCNKEPVFVVGLRLTSLVGTRAELWFLTGRALPTYRKEVIGFIRRALGRTLRMYKHLMVYVNKDFTKGQRFVEFFGFERTMSLASLDKQVFEVYEKRA